MIVSFSVLDIANVCEDSEWLTAELPVCASLSIYRGQFVKRSNVLPSWSTSSLRDTIQALFFSRYNNLPRNDSSHQCLDHLREALCLMFVSVCSRPASGHCGQPQPVCKAYFRQFLEMCGKALELASLQHGSHSAIGTMIAVLNRTSRESPHLGADHRECIHLPVTRTAVKGNLVFNVTCFKLSCPQARPVIRWV